MKYHVQWDQRAEDQLADIWMKAPDRQAVNDATNRIDQILTYSPETKGVEFYGDRLLVEPPLQVVFKIYPDDLRVDVLDVWHP